MYDIAGAAKSFFEMIAKWIGYKSDQAARNNSADMQKADKLQKEQAEADSDSEAIEKGDIDEIRKKVSE